MLCPNCGKEEFRGCGNHGWKKGEGLLCAVCGWQVREYLPSPDKILYQPRDIEDFYEHPSQIMANMQRLHFTNVNSTIPYFGPILYFLIRQFTCDRVLEIGHAEGYTSFYMAQGVKDNAIRFGLKDNMYFGIDIVQTESTREKLVAAGLPVTVENKDSMTLSKDWHPEVTFDLIFQDGAHDLEHIMYEWEVLWPRLRTGGGGYFLMHDVYGPGELGCQAVLDKIRREKIPVEFIRFGGMYGLLIIRKLEGYDPRLWKWEVPVYPQFTKEEVEKNAL